MSGRSLFLYSEGSPTCNRTTSCRRFLYLLLPSFSKIINLEMDDACSEYRCHLSLLAQIRGEHLCHFLLLHASLFRSPALCPDMFTPQLNQIRLYLPTENLALHIKFSRNGKGRLGAVHMQPFKLNILKELSLINGGSVTRRRS